VLVVRQLLSPLLIRDPTCHAMMAGTIDPAVAPTVLGFGAVVYALMRVPYLGALAVCPAQAAAAALAARVIAIKSAKAD